MLIVIIVAVVFSTISGIIAYKQEKDQYCWVDSSEVFASVFGAFMAIIVLGTAISLPLHAVRADTELELVNEQYIYSLEGGSSIDGNFVLGTGQVNSELVYIYYECQVVDNKCFFTVKHISTKNTKIVEDDFVAPNIKIYQEKVINPNWWTMWGTIVVKRQSSAIITVPKGTIRQVYSGSFGG